MAKTITPKQALDWLSNGEALLIDVRTPDEFKTEHISYAQSLPLDNVCELFAQMKIHDDTKLIFQCMKGARGQTACAAITDKNLCHNEIYNMEGGISEWKAAGLPVITQNTSGLSIMRQVQIIVGGLVAFMTILGLMGLTFGFIIAAVLGAALCFAGLTGWCGLAMLLSHMPWNKK